MKVLQPLLNIALALGSGFTAFSYYETSVSRADDSHENDHH